MSATIAFAAPCDLCLSTGGGLCGPGRPVPRRTEGLCDGCYPAAFHRRRRLGLATIAEVVAIEERARRAVVPPVSAPVAVPRRRFREVWEGGDD